MAVATIMPSNNRDLQLDLLDSAQRGARLAPVHVPPSGWIKAIRTAVGMTRQQLARRLGVSASTVADLERSEADGTISLKSLRRVASALQLEVVYAPVPPHGKTLNDLVREQAESVASRRMARVHHTMSLEDQSVDKETRDAQFKRAVERLLAGSRRNLWL